MEYMEKTGSSGSIFWVLRKNFNPKFELRTTGYFFSPMGPGIDFPLVMNYRAEGQQGSSPEAHSPFTLHASPFTNNYFYFLNGHGDVTYFADANFTPEQVESYEYSPWGVLLTSASKNNLLYTAREFDFETGLYNYIAYYFLPSIVVFNFAKKLNSETILILSFNINKKITEEYKSNIFLNPLFKRNAWWVGPAVLLIAACVINDAIKDCAAHCQKACEKSGGVDTCKDKLCGICDAKCKK